MTNTIELPTPYGTIGVVPQSDLEVYIPGSELTVTVGASFRANVSGHFTRERKGGSWLPYKSTWQVKKRRPSGAATARWPSSVIRNQLSEDWNASRAIRPLT